MKKIATIPEERIGSKTEYMKDSWMDKWIGGWIDG